MISDTLEGEPLAGHETLEMLNAASGERRLVAGLALATVAVCVPTALLLAITMPKHASVLVAPPPPPISVVTTLPPPAPAAPIAPAAPAARAPAPKVVPVSVPALATPAPAPAPVAAKRTEREEPKPAVHKAKVKKVKKADDGVEIWPASQPSPKEEDGPGGDDLKRPSF